jgi:acetyl esterase
MPLDPRIEAALALLPPRPPDDLPPAARRAEAQQRTKQMPPMRTPTGRLWDEKDLTAIGPNCEIPVRVYRTGPGLHPGLIVIHGGGWWLGTLDEGDEMCRRRATTAGCTVVAVDYRLAPEHPFPKPLNDCWAATRWVFQNAEEIGIDKTRVAIAGQSAGGNLAAAVTLLARDSDEVSFVAQVLEVPATDLTLHASEGSATEFAEGYFLTRADLIECVNFYLSGQNPCDRLASPLLADLHDLPPALVMTAEFDPVRDDGEAYAAKLERGGIPVSLHRWDGMIHASAEMDFVVPDVAKAYTAEVAAFLRGAFGLSDGTV